MARSASIALLSACAAFTSAEAREYKAWLDIPAQTLEAALKEFGVETDSQVLFTKDIVTGRTSLAVKGVYTQREALEQLLQGTGLRVERSGDRVFLIKSAQAAAAEVKAAAAETPAQGKAPASGEAAEDEDKEGKTEEKDVEKVTVTGSRIRGAKTASPVVTITQDEMRRSGQNNLGEVARALPQNFAGGQNPGVTSGPTIGGALSNQNVSGGSGFNLRGLGADATLTLLNGARLPYDGLFQATDISVIPVAAIERVEILLDGASAIYGSDAVGGVANIVLKRDYEGAELSARFGAATDGGYEQQQYTAVAGTNWDSGGFLITGDYSDSDSVKARHRDTLRQLTNQNVDIYPQSTQKGGLFSGHQGVGAFGRFNIDAFYTKREQESLSQNSATTFFYTDRDSSIWAVLPSLDVALPGDWSARLHGAFGRNETESTGTRFSVATGLQTSKFRNEFFNGMQAAGIELEGPLLALPGGDLRASIGGGYRKNSLDQRGVNLITTAVSGVVPAEVSSRYVYGEVGLPLISEDQNIPLVTRLSLNGALRYETYDTFGASTTPKVGAIWGLAPGFDIKASWGKSFKVPTLFDRYAAIGLELFPGSSFGGAADSQMLMLFGSDPDLTPEKAEIVTAGFVAQPEFLSNFRLEFGYFDIDYTDRVAAPIDNFGAALSNPVYAEFVTLNPTVAQQNAVFAAMGFPVGSFSLNQVGVYDPAKVIAIVDFRNRNVSSHRVEGLDLTMSYSVDLLGGDLSLSGNGSWITKGVRKLSDLAPEQLAAGVNFWPPKFKGRLGAGWLRDGFSLNANVNHIDGIVDRSVTPNVKRSSMTTLDLVADYQADLDVVGDVGFTLAVTNVLNEAPPFLQPPFAPAFIVNYDSTNYSALGRVVNVTVTKRF